MKLKFHCYECGKKYGVDAEMAGKRMECKRCLTINIIPKPHTRDYRLAKGDEEDSLPDVLSLDAADTQKNQDIDGLVGLPVTTKDTFDFPCRRCGHPVTAELGRSGYACCPACGDNQLIPLRDSQAAERLLLASLHSKGHKDIKGSTKVGKHVSGNALRKRRPS